MCTATDFILCFRTVTRTNIPGNKELDGEAVLRIATSLCIMLINNDEDAVHQFLNTSPTSLFLNRLVDSKQLPYCVIPDEYDYDDDDRYYLSPLYITIKHGSFSLMTRMIEFGVSLQELSSYGENALHALCYSKVDSVAKYVYLIRRDRTLIASVDINGSGPIRNAAMAGQDIILTILPSMPTEVGGAGHSHHASLKWETVTGQGRTSHGLINNVDDVNSKDKDGYTHLMLSAKRGYAACVSLLLRRGADVCLTNGRYEDALKLARRNNKTGTS